MLHLLIHSLLPQRRVSPSNGLFCALLSSFLSSSLHSTQVHPFVDTLTSSYCRNSPPSYRPPRILLTSIDIASSFDELAQESWIANAYLLTNTAFLPAYG